MSNGEISRAAPELAQEDVARADCYALIGRLFYDAPDSLLLAELCRTEARAEDPASALARAWEALHAACRSAYPAVLKQEFDSLFVGVGRSPVTPYTSHYITGISPDRHLVHLRERLAGLGLSRRSAAFEVEDHVSGICDVMRILIAEGHTLEEQRQFFNEFAYPGTVPLCDAVAGASAVSFYHHVAAFTREFVELERQAFDMHDAGA